MNSKTFPSATQAFLNSSNKPLRSSLPSHILFHINTTRVKISTRQRKITAKASSAASFIPAPEKETLYELLGISENGTLSEIKRAYKKMALKYHPDVSPPDRAEEYTVRFIRVQKAYETLSDPEARSMYDTCMAKGFVFSGRSEARFDPRSDDKKRWKVQITELHRRSSRVDQAREMSWAARIRKQRSKSSFNGSDYLNKPHFHSG